ncbi:MAG: hypothetical protein WBE43_08220, partial [Candidatus Acidiferrales bacterium]
MASQLAAGRGSGPLAASISGPVTGEAQRTIDAMPCVFSHFVRSNRHTAELGIAVTHTKQRPAQFLIATFRTLSWISDCRFS